METVSTTHTPVLLKEVIEILQVRPGGVYVDCTLGLGGHSRAILERLQGKGRLIGLDRDNDSLSLARAELGEFGELASFYNENFKNLPLLLRNLGIQAIDGCLVDLGVSRFQLTEGERGFSLQEEGPLDMRMDRSQLETAEHLVNRLSEPELRDLLWEFGEESRARKIAAAIVDERQKGRIRTTRQLADLILRVKGRNPRIAIHPATKTFQALRIAVNQELEGLEQFISRTIPFLKEEARLAMISFHSLEDRIVKRTFRLESGKCICFKPGDLCRCPRLQRVRILTRKPVGPSREEVLANPSSRSSKLRAVEKSRENGNSNHPGETR